MEIAIVGGTGDEGMGLALRWARAGEEIIIGSREESKASEAAAQISAQIGAGARVEGPRMRQRWRRLKWWCSRSLLAAMRLCSRNCDRHSFPSRY